MDKKKIAIIALGLLLVGGATYVAAKLYKKSKTTSQDPDKNNRKILITKA